jgi:BNR repeat-containing family member
MDLTFLLRTTLRAISSLAGLLLLAAVILISYPSARSDTRDAFPANYVAGTLIQLNDNGAWSWFMDPRAIVDNGRLIVGSVRAVGNFSSGASDPRWGNVEISVYDFAAKKVSTIVLHPHLEQDDHDAPAFLVRPDGRYLAMYSKHAAERRMYYRISEPHNALAWGPILTVETPGSDANYAGNNDTYANPFRLPDGRILNFYRGFHHEPNYLVSKDDGQTWTYGGHWLYGKGGYSPYLKYAYDGKGTVHFVATEDHPRNFDNSLYHGYLRNATIYQSNGTPVGPLSTSTEAKIAAWELTKIFQGTPDNVAWMIDLQLDRDDHPYVLFSCQIDGRGLPRGQGGMDLRYHYARWDGAAWHSEEIAHAGRRLYPGEDDYSGLGALDPRNPDLVYISTDADPVSGAPLISQADHQRHYELFRGTRDQHTAKWTWTPITRNSTYDNLRPIIPKWPKWPKSNDSRPRNGSRNDPKSYPRTALLWLRGSYSNNHGEWTTAVVALILPPR